MIRYFTYFIFHPLLRGMLLLCGSVVAIIALASYNRLDPSMNFASDTTPQNWLGTNGAIFADLILQVFGYMSIVIMLLPFSWGIILLKHRHINYWKLRALSWVMLMFLLTTNLGLYFNDSNLPSHAGILGFYGLKLIQNFNLAITTLPFQFTLFIISLGLFIFATGVRKEDLLKITSIITSVIKHNILRLLLMGMAILKFLWPFKARDKEKENEQNFPKPPQSTPKKTKSFFAKKPTSKVAPATIVNNASGDFQLPNLDLFKYHQNNKVKGQSEAELQNNATELLKALNDFGVKGEILEINQGPVVTLYEFEPAAGTKSSRVIGLADDIARTLCAISTRIAVIPGRNALGIELPNKNRAIFYLRELLESSDYTGITQGLPIVLGKNLSGNPYVVDLSKMPHLLVAGTTGSGKSVAINTMILSLLYKYSPEDCKFIMIDPKMLELSVYDGIPHLLTPVVTEPGKAVVALKWAVREMENRYRKMANLGVRNISNYNNKILTAKHKGSKLEREIQTGFDPETGKPIYESVPIEMEKMPYIVVIVDEMADLMLVAGKDIESSIQRLAQMARAAGIHIIMATQRPSVDVITGVIKANFPSRVSFKVTSKIDSRTILGEQGAEQLLGMGDMLYMGGASQIHRVHGPFVDDEEVANIAAYLKSQASPTYITSVTENIEDDDKGFDDNVDNGNDLYAQAVAIIKRDRKVSTSYIQRCLRIGYNRAANIIEQMEREGLITPPNHSGKRELLIPE